MSAATRKTVHSRARRALCLMIALVSVSSARVHAEPAPRSIHRAVRDDDNDNLRKWLAKDMALLNARDADGMTPLHIAICKNRLGPFSFLLASGANVNLVTGPSRMKIDRDDGTVAFREERGQWAPLHLAAYANRLEMVKALIGKGAKVDPRNDLGETPLYLAAQEGHLSIVRALLAHGADVNAKSTKSGWNPMEAAVFAGYIETGTMLQANGGELTVLSTAGLGLVTETTTFLHKDPTLLNGNGSALKAPLFWAAMNGQTSVARLLIDQGADIEVKDTQMRTPIMIASITGATSVVQLLCIKGARVNEFDRRGMTALHYAAEFGRVGVAETLLTHGARTDRKSIRGLTPIDLAREKEQIQIVELFDRRMDESSEAKAKPSQPDRGGTGRLTRGN